mgnify:CR=1 FL=1
MEPGRILIVKFGAFGNIVLSFRAFAAIRAHHPGARVSVLTTSAFADWMRRMPWFDEVLVADRWAWTDWRALLRLRRTLRAGRFNRVYDLQTVRRSSFLLRLVWPARPEWSGIAPGCSHPDRDPDRDRIHDMDRQHGQLRQAGIADIPPMDLSWSRGDIARFGLPARFAILIPGASAHRPAKRWPVERYAALAEALRARGVAPVVVGSAGEAELAQAIPAAIDLTGRTEPGDIADLARAAAVAVGNDTGPTHLVAAAGCPTVTLFSFDSDPALCAPRGPATAVARTRDLADLTLEVVLAAVADLVHGVLEARDPVG